MNDIPTFTPEELAELAYHEAGHTVMAYLRGWSIKRGVTINPAVASCWKADQPDSACVRESCALDKDTCHSYPPEYWTAAGMSHINTPNPLAELASDVLRDLIDNCSLAR